VSAPELSIEFRVANEYALTLEGMIDRSFNCAADEGNDELAYQIINATDQLMDFLRRKFNVLKDNPYWRDHFYFASIWLP
jgi:hypothetical protein